MATGSPNREFTSEELDAMAAAELPVENPETSRTASAAPVASAPTAPEATGSPELAVGDGTSFSMQEPSRGPAMGPVAKLEAGREYSTEELDLIEQANKPKEFTADELDKSLVSTVFDDPTYIPTRDEYFEAKQLKARLKSEGKIPGLLEDAATGAQGFLQTIGDTIHEISDDPGEFLARSPATMKATAKKSWRNTNDVTRWIRQTNAPTPIGRDEQTGEFVFGQSGAGRSDAEVLAGQQQAAAGQGRSIRAVTEEDLKDEEFDRFVMERSRQKELEEWVASTTAPTEFVTRLVTGRNQTEQPMQAPSELAGGLLEPTNIATMGVPLSAGAKTLGLSRLTKAGGARAARVLDRAAAKGIAGMETGAAKFQEIIQKGTKISPENQIKMAKWSAAGGIGGGVFGLDSDIPGVAQAQDAAKFIGGAYLGYKGGLGVLRTVQKISGSTATILRVASDAGEGFDDIAQASVATKLEAFPELSLVREALENPTRFRPIESTPARLAADPRLGKQTRAIADALASPAIVQGVRGTSAVATGAVKGAVANAPFVALALNADEDKAAANMFGMGVGFGAVGGAAGRFTGLEQRRAESRAFDTARMLMDVELAGGDVTKTIQTYSTQQLGDLAAMQGFFRDKVDFVPLDGIERAGDSDFIKNAKVQFQNGAAGLFIQAPPGEKARVFVNLDAKRDGIVPHELGARPAQERSPRQRPSRYDSLLHHPPLHPSRSRSPWPRIRDRNDPKRKRRQIPWAKLPRHSCINHRQDGRARPIWTPPRRHGSTRLGAGRNLCRGLPTSQPIDGLCRHPPPPSSRRIMARQHGELPRRPSQRSLDLWRPHRPCHRPAGPALQSEPHPGDRSCPQKTARPIPQQLPQLDQPPRSDQSQRRPRGPSRTSKRPRKQPPGHLPRLWKRRHG